MVGIKRIAKRYYFRQIVCCWMIFCMAFVLPVKVAMAADWGPDPDTSDSLDGFMVGAGVIKQDFDRITDVTVATEESVIHWDSVDTIDNEQLNFFKGGLTGAHVLNRVTSGTGTDFAGDLSAESGMTIYLINPAGIVFTGDASINVPHLVASSLNMSNDAFSDAVAGGDMVFTEDPAFDGIGEGKVTNDTDEFDNYNVKRIYLIGRQVINNGTLLADECVVMAAGNKVIISDTGGVVGVEVTMPDQTPGEYTYEIVNDGGIEVDGGDTGGGIPENPAQVVLAAGDIWSSAYIKANGAGSASLDMQAEGIVSIGYTGNAALEEGVYVNAYPGGGDGGGDAVATIEIDAGGDISVRAEVEAEAFGNRETNAEATVKVNQRRTKDGLGFGDLNVIAAAPVKPDGTVDPTDQTGPEKASIIALAENGMNNEARVFICADNVTVESKLAWENKYDAWTGSEASIEAIAEFEDGTNQSNVADVQIGAKGTITVTAISDSYKVKKAWNTDATASISAEAINGEENDASVFVCSQDDVLVKAEKDGIAKIKSLAGDVYNALYSEATTTVISHSGDIVVKVVDSSETVGGEALIESVANTYYGYPTATTAVYGKDVVVAGAGAIIKAEGIPPLQNYSMSDDGPVAETGADSSLTIDNSDGVDLDCPDCGEPDPDPDPVAAPIPFRIPRIEGCPELTIAAAMELGINSDTIQVAIGNALALNPNIQPCEACESLVDASNILKDEDGSKMAAMLAAFNAQTSPGAPFTPEMGASITMALADAAQDDQYALSVAEYIDAFVMYVAVLDTELGAPVGDSVAFVMEKYGEGVLANEDIAEFVASRIANMEVFGG